MKAYTCKLHMTILPFLTYLQLFIKKTFKPMFTQNKHLNTYIHCMSWEYLEALLVWPSGEVGWGFDDGQKNCCASGDVTPVVSDDVERSRPRAHSRNLLCQISGDQGRRFLLSHTEIRVNIRANGGFKPPQVFVGRSRGPSCPICVRAITSASH